MTHEEVDLILAGLPRTLDAAQRRLAGDYLAAHPSLGANEAECVVLLMSWAAETWPAGTFLGDLARLPVVQVRGEDFADLRRAKEGWDKGRAAVADMEAKLREAEERIKTFEDAIAANNVREVLLEDLAERAEHEKAAVVAGMLAMLDTHGRLASETAEDFIRRLKRERSELLRLLRGVMPAIHGRATHHAHASGKDWRDCETPLCREVLSVLEPKP